MNKRSVYGKKYIVTITGYWFKEGDIVICLQGNDDLPFVIHEDEYPILFGDRDVYTLSPTSISNAYLNLDCVHVIDMEWLKEVNDK